MKGYGKANGNIKETKNVNKAPSNTVVNNFIKKKSTVSNQQNISTVSKSHNVNGHTKSVDNTVVNNFIKKKSTVSNQQNISTDSNSHNANDNTKSVDNTAEIISRIKQRVASTNFNSNDSFDKCQSSIVSNINENIEVPKPTRTIFNQGMVTCPGNAELDTTKDIQKEVVSISKKNTDFTKSTIYPRNTVYDCAQRKQSELVSNDRENNNVHFIPPTILNFNVFHSTKRELSEEASKIHDNVNVPNMYSRSINRDFYGPQREVVSGIRTNIDATKSPIYHRNTVYDCAQRKQSELVSNGRENNNVHMIPPTILNFNVFHSSERELTEAVSRIQENKNVPNMHSRSIDRNFYGTQKRKFDAVPKMNDNHNTHKFPAPPPISSFPNRPKNHFVRKFGEPLIAANNHIVKKECEMAANNGNEKIQKDVKPSNNAVVSSDKAINRPIIKMEETIPPQVSDVPVAVAPDDKTIPSANDSSTSAESLSSKRKPKSHKLQLGIGGNYYCDTCELFCSDMTALTLHYFGAQHMKARMKTASPCQSPLRGHESAVGSPFKVPGLSDEDDSSEYAAIEDMKRCSEELWRSNFYCQECSFECLSIQTYNLHVNGKSHQKKVCRGTEDPSVYCKICDLYLPRYIMTVHLEDTARHRVKSLENATEEPVAKKAKLEKACDSRIESYCTYCQVTLTSYDESNAHFQSADHLNRMTGHTHHCSICNVKFDNDIGLNTHYKGYKHYVKANEGNPNPSGTYADRLIKERQELIKMFPIEFNYLGKANIKLEAKVKLESTTKI